MVHVAKAKEKISSLESELAALKTRIAAYALAEAEKCQGTYVYVCVWCIWVCAKNKQLRLHLDSAPVTCKKGTHGEIGTCVLSPLKKHFCYQMQDPFLLVQAFVLDNEVDPACSGF